MVSFTKQTDGRYYARIDGVEIIFDQHSFDMRLYEMVTQVPCDYGPCPSDGSCKPEWAGTDNCPHEYELEEATETIFEWSYPSLQETIEGAKNIIRTRLTRKHSWPASARRFVDEVWTHKKEDAHD